MIILDIPVPYFVVFVIIAFRETRTLRYSPCVTLAHDFIYDKLLEQLYYCDYSNIEYNSWNTHGHQANW